MRAAVCVLALVVRASLLASAQDPKSLVGTWTWSWKDGQGEKHTHFLDVESSGERLVARERFDDQVPVKVTDLKLLGKRVTFTVMRGDGRASYDGSLASTETINGTVTIARDGQVDEYGWTAKKEAPKKR
jgi:hypothetical protein